MPHFHSDWKTKTEFVLHTEQSITTAIEVALAHFVSQHPSRHPHPTQPQLQSQPAGFYKMPHLLSDTSYSSQTHELPEKVFLKILYFVNWSNWLQ